MKKIISAILACVLMLGCLLTLASCGGIDNGEYVSKETGETIKVSGRKMLIENDALDGLVFVYKFKIKADKETGEEKITLTLKKIKYDGDDKATLEKIKSLEAGINALDPEKSFEVVDGGFKMNGVKYTAK
jgi:hypothetical protein